MAITMIISVDNDQVGEIDNIPYVQDMNVQQAMEGAYNLGQDAAYNFSIRYYGQALGYLVTTLDNISTQVGSDPNTFLFWELFVNDQMSSTGIDSTVLLDGDLVGWNYTNYSADRHTGTPYEHMRSFHRA